MNRDGKKKLADFIALPIEHHLFPDLPASRYPEIAPRVQALCERYGQRYNTGSFGTQLGSVARNLVRLSLPSPA